MKLDDRWAGKNFECPKGSFEFRVPGEKQASPPPQETDGEFFSALGDTVVGERRARGSVEECPDCGDLTSVY